MILDLIGIPVGGDRAVFPLPAPVNARKTKLAGTNKERLQARSLGGIPFPRYEHLFTKEDESLCDRFARKLHRVIESDGAPPSSDSEIDPLALNKDLSSDAPCHEHLDTVGSERTSEGLPVATSVTGKHQPIPELHVRSKTIEMLLGFVEAARPLSLLVVVVLPLRGGPDNQR